MREKTTFHPHNDQGHDSPIALERSPETLREETREVCRRFRDRVPFNREEMHKMLFITAHADDEVIGYGTEIAAVPEAFTIQITDSAPKVPTDTGGRSVEDFKEHIRDARRDELDTALNLAGHNPYQRECLGFSDQDVMNQIAAVAIAIADRVEKNGIRYVFTHGYEGGHPDHDAAAAAAHLAKEMLAKKGIHIGIVETPLYKGVPGNERERTWQEFADGVQVAPEDTFVKMLDAGEIELKRNLEKAHASQAHVFKKTFQDRELFRVAPDYDFDIPPNNGHVTNIFPEFGLTHEKWKGLVRAARSKLGI